MAGSGTPATAAVADALLAGLVDDAALFPPARLPLHRALAEHTQHRQAWYAAMVGPFLCPAAAVAQLQTELDADGALPVVLIAPPAAPDPVADLRTAVARVQSDERLQLTGVELPQPAGGAPVDVVTQLDVTVPVWLEVNRAGDWRGTVDAIAELRGAVFAKLRMGGVEAAAVPSDAQVAGFLRHAVASGVPFKLTAGLHHAVRLSDPATGSQHGVLNVLCAVYQAQHAEGSNQVLATLAQRDPAVLAAMARALSVEDVIGVRTMFRSFGCCGVRDPIDDLVALGLLTTPAASENR